MAEGFVKPALTPEQWTEAIPFPWPDYRYDIIFGAWPDGRGSQRHAHAAMALYGQPFGFTQEDVRLLRKWANPLAGDIFPPLTPELLKREFDEECPSILALADRIAALLPPEGA